MLGLDRGESRRSPRFAKIHRIRCCRNVRVFGSVASGENGPNSDVDFLVDLDKGRGLLDMGGLLSDLEELLGVEVDLVESGGIHPYIWSRVLAEAKPL